MHFGHQIQSCKFFTFFCQFLSVSIPILCEVDRATEEGIQNGGIYDPRTVEESVIEHDKATNAIRVREGKEPIKAIVLRRDLPTRKSAFRNILRIPGVQSSHCITYDRAKGKVL